MDEHFVHQLPEPLPVAAIEHHHWRESYFFADGMLGDVSGFFLLEGRRERLDGLRRDEAFVRQLLQAGAATRNVRSHALVAGSEAGRLVNLYREVRQELGLI